jgi:protein phosphatase 1 regulatory subunit 42
VQQLFSSNNKLNDMKEMNILLKCWKKLWKLELSGNPLCFKAKYRERIIVVTPNIEVLDGKEINNTSRQFLQSWKANKETVKRKEAFASPNFERKNFTLGKNI